MSETSTKEKPNSNIIEMWKSSIQIWSSETKTENKYGEKSEMMNFRKNDFIIKKKIQFEYRKILRKH